jgi:phage baseplate assembly protein W
VSEQFIGRGWAFPLRDDRTAGSRSSSREREIEEAIRLILGTSPGERRCGPSSAAGSTSTCSRRPTARRRSAIARRGPRRSRRWEPRIDVEDVEVTIRRA